jgi:hypothetical protein
MKKKLQHILKPLVQKKIGPKNYGIWRCVFWKTYSFLCCKEHGCTIYIM